jgi:uncharacterized membrane protein (DUF485 family)
MIDQRERALEELAAQRWGIAIRLSAAMLIVFGVYEVLTAFARPLLSTTLFPGLSLGLFLGAVVMVVALALTGIYVHWANNVYDPAIRKVEGS